MTVSFGSEVGQVLPGRPDGRPIILELVVLPRWWWVIALIVVALILLFVVLAIRTDLLRDNVNVPAGSRRPYSLMRTQLAVWLFVVLSSYLTIWAITSDLDGIPATVLVLVGISSTTALGSLIIDERTPPTPVEPTAVSSPATAAPTTSPLERTSQGFLKDILSETSGLSVHRFQLFAWTVVLAFVFVVSVYNDLAMPAFDATLLGLMGLSSATYLGLKIPEQRGTPTAGLPSKQSKIND